MEIQSPQEIHVWKFSPCRESMFGNSVPAGNPCICGTLLPCTELICIFFNSCEAIFTDTICNRKELVVLKISTNTGLFIETTHQDFRRKPVLVLLHPLIFSKLFDERTKLWIKSYATVPTFNMCILKQGKLVSNLKKEIN